MKRLKTEDCKLKADLGQFFLEDKSILQRILSAAEIQPNEIVLEIGAGDGRLTRLLAQTAKKVIAVEIDKKFEPVLKQLPSNVEIIIDDALKFLGKKKYDKLVANLPSTLTEPILHKLISVNFKLAVFLVPEKFAYKIEKHPVFCLYFETKLIEKVLKTAFQPMPRTNWEIILITKKKDPSKTGNLDLFLRRFVYEHPKAKVKNSLVEGLIKFRLINGERLTKNQARLWLNQNPPAKRGDFITF